MPQGLPTVIPNEVILSAHINNIADRVVGRFATTAERDAAITTPVSGMCCAVAGYLQVYRAGAWHQYTPPDRFAVAGTGGTSGGSLPNIQVLSMPAQPANGVLLLWSMCRVDFNGGSSYQLELRDGATVASKHVFVAAQLAAGQVHFVNVHATRNVTAGVAATYSLNGVGTANVTTFGDSTVNRLDAIYIPNP